MQDYYKTLGVSSAATREEVRRAYRILARRYHPDVNPGRETAETFRQISMAYEILSDEDRRKQYDKERHLHETFSSAFDRAHQAYQRQQQFVRRPTAHRPQPQQQAPPQPPPQPSPQKPQIKPITAKPITAQPPPARRESLREKITTSLKKARRIITRGNKPTPPGKEVSSITILEVSVSVFEAITGTRKSVEITERDGATKKVSVSIPAGVRQGSLVRLRHKEDDRDELVVIIRVAHHPWISISHLGLTIEVPITVAEAMNGTKVQIPSLGDPLLVTVDRGIQSGSEVRLKGQGIKLPNGTRGDLFIRFMVKTPPLPESAEFATMLTSFESLYTTSVRDYLPRTIMEAEEIL